MRDFLSHPRFNALALKRCIFIHIYLPLTISHTAQLSLLLGASDVQICVGHKGPLLRVLALFTL